MAASTCYKCAIFLLAWAIFFNGYMFRNSISPIVDVLEHDFNTSASGVGTLGSFIHLFYFSMQIPCGILLEIVAPRYVLPTSSILLGIAIIIFSFSDTITFAIILSSAGGLLQSPAALCYFSIMDDIFTTSEYPVAMGIQMCLTYGGLYVANYIQAVIYDTYADWRIFFLVLGIWAILAGFCFIILVIDYPNSKKQIKSFRVSPRKVKNSMSGHKLYDLKPKKITPMSNDDGDETRLLVSENHSKSTIESLKRAFCLKWNWILSMWGFCGLLLVNAFNGFWFISYLMIKFSYSRGTAALISGSFYLMRALSAPILGLLAKHFAKRKIFLVMGSIAWICSVVIIYGLQSDDPLFIVLTLNLIAGIGGGTWGLLWALQREYNAYYECKETAAGLVNTLQNSAGFVGQLFIGEMLDIAWKERNGEMNVDGDRIYSVNDYDFALIIIPIVVAGAMISALMLKETNAQNLDYAKKNDS